MTKFDYPKPVSKLLTLGEIQGTPEWRDYSALGLGPEHVPDLIRMTLDDDLYRAGPDNPEVWSSIHAWRALAQLHAGDAAEPLTRLLSRIDEFRDDWVGEDLPRAFGILGPAAIPTLRDYLADSAHGLWARVAAAHSLQEIADQHSHTCDDVIAVLARQLEHFEEQDRTLNACIVSYLACDLKAVTAAPIIKKAYAAGRVDLSMLGDWEDAQGYLGLLYERQTPAPNYIAVEQPKLAAMMAGAVRALQSLDHQLDAQELPSQQHSSDEPKKPAKRKRRRKRKK
ncbi:MAG: DUF1186 domain-containing protein [Chloroflexi bacterium]|nr:DUF1186 domain-containing protein [Chloroflexota bacterium]